MAGDDLEQERRVGQVVRERADLVERAGEGDQAVAADPAVGRLQADDPAERGGLADRAAGVGARATAARGRRRPPRPSRPTSRRGCASSSQGLQGRAVGAVLGRRAHRELVHVRLAEEDRVGGLRAGRSRWRRRAAGSSRASGCRRSSARPRTQSTSLIATGTPASAPSGSPALRCASTARAWARTASASRWTKTLSRLRAARRGRGSRATTSSDVTAPAFNWAEQGGRRSARVEDPSASQIPDR